MQKSEGERRIESVTWGLLFAWIGVTMVSSFDNSVPGLAGVVAGAIAGTSAVVQRALGYSAGLLLWALAAVLVLTNIDDLLGSVDTPVFSLLLIAIGMFLMVRGSVAKSWVRLVLGLFMIIMGLGALVDVNISVSALVFIATGLWLLSRAFRRKRPTTEITQL